jgi:hypothetical protein
MVLRAWCPVLGALCLVLASPATAQVAADDVPLPFAYTGPAPPQLPATVARDGEGTTVRAIRLTTPLRVDGRLDEAIYTSTTPASDFIQAEPRSGEPGTEETEVWVAFDNENVYVGVRASETQPERMVINEMRRDAAIWQNENFAVAFDTFYDRRNSVLFQFTPIGGWADGQNTNEGNYSGDWNPVWTFAVERTESGWTGEAAIPFKSLRYRQGRGQIWGIQFRRVNRWKNEVSYLTRLPDGLGTNGVQRTSRFATLVGIEAPPGSRALDIKPYVTSSLTTDATATPRVSNEFGRDAGLDIKYGLTPNLTANFTYRTDFAQVEADEQQVNLTRFSLFFPEKREFFLENAGIFTFAGVTGTQGDSPILFYSRRIGLEQGQQVPIEGGGRLTGRIGRYQIGFVNIQTDDVGQFGVPSTNFGVARIRRDILGRSYVGAMATRRSASAVAPGSAETYGVDTQLRFFTNLTINSHLVKTTTHGLSGDDISHREQFNYDGDRYGLQMEHLVVGANVNPEMGFLRRTDFTKDRMQARFSPRPRSGRVRKYTYQASVEYWKNKADIKEMRELLGEFYVEFQNSDRIEITHTDTFERIPAPFRIARGITVPAGGYDNRIFKAQYELGQQRFTSGTVFVEGGPFYGGDRKAFGFTGGRVKLSPRFAIEPGMQFNMVSLPFGDFRTRLVSSRATYTMSPMMFVSGLLQYNSSNNSFSTNVRLRWEYLPGSELFVVYNEGRDTTRRGLPELQNRAFVVKVNRLLRF